MNFKYLDNPHIYVQGGRQKTTKANVQVQSDKMTESQHVRNEKLSRK